MESVQWNETNKTPNFQLWGEKKLESIRESEELGKATP